MPTNWTLLTANCNTGATDMMHKRNIWVGAVVGSLIGFFGPLLRLRQIRSIAILVLIIHTGPQAGPSGGLPGGFVLA